MKFGYENLFFVCSYFVVFCVQLRRILRKLLNSKSSKDQTIS